MSGNQENQNHETPDSQDRPAKAEPTAGLKWKRRWAGFRRTADAGAGTAFAVLSRAGRNCRARPLAALEWTASLILLALALYYLWWLVFPLEPSPGPPDDLGRREFRTRLRALPPPPPNPEWRVAARPGRWRGIVVHHTATAGGSPKSIDRYHREVNKWKNGLGYHFLIGNCKGMEDGEVAAGRRWLGQDSLDGSHVVMADSAKETLFNAPRSASGNSFAIGVALVGDFREEPPSAAQLAALRSLLNFLSREYGVEPSAIAGHNRVSASGTHCPGRCLPVEEVAASLAGS